LTKNKVTQKCSRLFITHQSY